MSRNPHNPEQPGEPQARELYGWVGAHTLMNGEHGENSNSLDLAVDVVPHRVAVHFPPSDDTAHRIEYTVRMADYLQPGSSVLPPSEGDAAMVSFRRTEHISEDDGYITEVGYYVTRTSEGGAQLECRVTGMRKESRARQGLLKVGEHMQRDLRVLDPAVTAIMGAREVVESASRNSALEQARTLGLLRVPAAEAEQVIYFVKNIPS